MQPLEGRHVVVTGAGGGVGPAVVKRLLDAGATCHTPQRRAEGGVTHARLKVTLGVDLTDEAAVVAYYQGLPPLWGSVQVAGGWAGGQVVDTALADVRAMLDRNFVTAFLCSREAVRSMARTGAGGRVVNFSSWATLSASPGAAAYAASKAALSSFTQALAMEVREQGIRVNALAPDTMDTAANRAAMPSADFARWVKPEEVAEAILWLLSPASSAVNGAIVPLPQH